MSQIYIYTFTGASMIAIGSGGPTYYSLKWVTETVALGFGVSDVCFRQYYARVDTTFSFDHAYPLPSCHLCVKSNVESYMFSQIFSSSRETDWIYYLELLYNGNVSSSCLRACQ